MSDTDVFYVWYMFNDSHVFDVWCVSVSHWDVFGVWHMFSDYHVSGVWCVSLCRCLTQTLNGGPQIVDKIELLELIGHDIIYQVKTKPMSTCQYSVVRKESLGGSIC